MSNTLAQPIGLLFNSLHVTFACSGLVSDAVCNPNNLRQAFRFLADQKSYATTYQQHFRSRFEYFKNHAKRPSYVYIPRYGELHPLAGHEIRVKSFREIRGGNIDYATPAMATGDCLLPYKIRANWRFATAPGTIAKFGGVKTLEISLWTRLYQGGLTIHSLEITVEPLGELTIDRAIAGILSITNDLSLHIRGGTAAGFSKVIAGIRSITDYPTFKLDDKTGSVEVDADNCFLLAQAAVAQAIKTEPVADDLKLSQTYRIITPDTTPVLSISTHRKELSGLIALEPRWRGKADRFVDRRLKRVNEGEDDGQFLVFHPACTILYFDDPDLMSPYDDDTSPQQTAKKKNVGEIKRFVSGCFRHNFSEIVLLGQAQRFLLDRSATMFQELRGRNYDTLGALDTLSHTIDSITSLPLFHPDWIKNRLDGGHVEFFDLIRNALAIERISNNSINTLQELRKLIPEGNVGLSLTIKEKIQLSDVINDLDSMSRISQQLANVDAYGLGSSASTAKAVAESAAEARNQLKARFDAYNKLSNLAPDYERQKYLADINQLVLTDYAQDVVPAFHELVGGLANQPDQLKVAARDLQSKGLSVPANQDLQPQLKQVVTEIDGLRSQAVASDPKDYEKIGSYVEKVRPYVQKLISAGNLILAVLGLFH